jgi:hypothetical protein
MNLSDSVVAILDSVQAALEDETAGGTLSDVKTIVRGMRARPMPALPAVWIVPQTALCERAEYDSQTWTLDISLAALVKNDDVEQGGKDAQRIAADALKAVLATRTTIVADVIDFVPATFDTTARSAERNRTLSWTEATARVIFTVTD